MPINHLSFSEINPSIINFKKVVLLSRNCFVVRKFLSQPPQPNIKLKDSSVNYLFVVALN